MLHAFLDENHDELVKRCRAKVVTRGAPATTAAESQFGIPVLLDQLVSTLQSEQSSSAQRVEVPVSICTSAGQHGDELLRKGYTIDQVVHDYGDLCQAVMELAHERQAPITVDEFHTFNRCLDLAIAGAVTEFGRQRDEAVSKDGTETLNDRLGSLAHDARNFLNSAMLAFHALKGSNMPLSGATGSVLGRSLVGLRDLIDRSLAEVRVNEGMPIRRAPIELVEFIEEVRIAAAMEAKAKGLTFIVSAVEKSWLIEGDRQMIFSAIGNLLQNAFKFTRPAGLVSLKLHATGGRLLIDIEDECGGLASGTLEALSRPLVQHGSDPSGLGLGLAVSRRAIEAHGGQLRATTLPGAGCTFTIDLPLKPPAPRG